MQQVSPEICLSKSCQVLLMIQVRMRGLPRFEKHWPTAKCHHISTAGILTDRGVRASVRGLQPVSQYPLVPQVRAKAHPRLSCLWGTSPAPDMPLSSNLSFSEFFQHQVSTGTPDAEYRWIQSESLHLQITYYMLVMDTYTYTHLHICTHIHTYICAFLLWQYILMLFSC